MRFYRERDVFAFSTILSLNWNALRGRKQLAFLRSIREFALAKAEKHGSKGTF